MLDQMFTAENFRKIYDLENRKGLDVASQFFPELGNFTFAIKSKVGEIRELRTKQQQMSPDAFYEQLNSLKNQLTDLKISKSDKIDELLVKVAAEVSATTFKLIITKKSGPKGKDVFCIDSKPESFFVIKQLQRNISSIYGVKQSNRHDLACELKETIGTKFPFELVRTDISAFYESIDRKQLLSKLDSDLLLSSTSRKFVKQIIDAYGQISQQNLGIPRGVGISAYLAELYLRKFDSQVRSIPGLVLYCRYVDDIVTVFARPPTGEALGSYKDRMISILADAGLQPNATKTYETKLSDPGKKTFEYLGYKFTSENYLLKISPSDSKIEKLKDRVERVFAIYEKMSSINAKRAYREIVARLKFLTGNTRLVNSKSAATTGIYYNNPLVTDPADFACLDTMLKKKILTIKRKKLRDRLKPYKFVDGFSDKRYHKFSAREFKTIVRAWKDA